jgi:hypothetical protein
LCPEFAVAVIITFALEHLPLPVASKLFLLGNDDPYYLLTLRRCNGPRAQQFQDFVGELE